MNATLFLILGLLMGGQTPTGTDTERLFAVRDFDPDTYRDPNFLEQFKNRSYRVRILAVELISLELK